MLSICPITQKVYIFAKFQGIMVPQLMYKPKHNEQFSLMMMKKNQLKILFAILAFLVSTWVYAGQKNPDHNLAGQWTQQSSGTANLLRALHFVNATTGWVVGDEGKIIKTADGGQSWVSQTSGTNIVLEGVHFVSPEVGWVVGNSGLILHTTNGGNNWVYQPSNSERHLRDVFFINAQTGWAVGSSETILHTTDGGQNWYTQYSGDINNLRAIRFASSTKGWAVGDGGTIFHTNDGGENWSEQNSSTFRILTSVKFVNDSTGWVTGTSGTIIKTIDGGQNWSAQASNTSEGLYASDFIDDHTGWAVGNGGAILHTTDGGNSWTQQTSGTFNWLWGVDFANPNAGWAIGWAGTVLHYQQETSLEAPLLTSPANNSTDVPTQTTFSWEAVSNAASYRLQISETYTFATLSFDKAGITELAEGVTNLDAQTTYYWRVNASNETDTSPWSEVWSFTTQTLELPEAVQLAYPENLEVVEIDENLAEIDLIWHPSQPAISQYQLDVAIDETFDTPLFSYDQITDTLFRLEGLQDNETYYWRVRAYNSSGWGSYSEVWSFTTDFIVGLHKELAGKSDLRVFSHYPNPFTQEVSIGFALPYTAKIQINIYNADGRFLETLTESVFHAGKHWLSWHANKELPNGKYFYRISCKPLFQPAQATVKTGSMYRIK